MITQYGVLKPDVPLPAGPFDEAHERWRQERREKYPDWKPLGPEWNVRFIHDEMWKERLFSVMCVREAISKDTFDWRKPVHWFWLSIGGLAVIADLMWYARIGR